MASISRGILGGFSGRVANVVGSSWKGIATMRALPLSVLNPRTAAQVGNRTRFGSLSVFSAAILTTIVKPLNDRFASMMSGYNLFTSRNKEAFTSEGIFVPGNLVLSTGKLGDAVIAEVTKTGIDVLTVVFPSAPQGAYEQASDKAYILVVNGDAVISGVSSGIVQRSAGSAVVTVDDNLILSNDCETYLSFLRADGTMVSNSAHVSGYATL